MVNQVQLEEDDWLDKYDTSGVDYSAFLDEEVTPEPVTEAETAPAPEPEVVPVYEDRLDQYDTSLVDYSGFPRPEIDEAEPGFLSDLGSVFSKGILETTGALATVGAATGLMEPEDTAALLQYIGDKEYVEPAALTEFMETVSKESTEIGQAWQEDRKLAAVGEGFDLIGKSMWEIVTNPKGAALATAEQGGNLIATYIPGFAAGAAGMQAGPIVGGVAFLGGMAVGGAVVETGAAMRELIAERGGDPSNPETIIAILKDPEAMEDVTARAVKKGVTVAVTDVLFNLMGLKLVKGIKKSAEGTIKATSALPRVAGAGVIGMVGGGVGEAAGETLKSGEINWEEVGAEVALGGTTTITDILVTAKGLKTFGPPTAEPTPPTPAAPTDTEAVEIIQGAPDYDSAIAAAEDIADGGPLPTMEVETIPEAVAEPVGVAPLPTIEVEAIPEGVAEPVAAPLPTIEVEEIATATTQLEKFFKVPEGSFTEVSVEPKTEQERKARRLVESLGKKIVFFDPGTSDVTTNGIVIPDQPGTIYINKNADRPHMVVLGHEVLHEMKRDRPEIYNELKAAIEPMLKDYKPYKKWVNQQQKRVGIKRLPKGDVVEELIADTLGDSFADPKFWDAMANKSPTLFESISETVQEFLGKFITSLDKKQLKGTGYVKDYIKARSELAKAIKRYQEKALKPVEKPVKVKPIKEIPSAKEKARVEDERAAKKPERPTPAKPGVPEKRRVEAVSPERARRERAAEVKRVGAVAAKRPEAPTVELGTSLTGQPAAEGWVTETKVEVAGKPATVYRGGRTALTPEKFKRSALGRATNRPSSGLGVWFTNSKSEARGYGPTVTATKLDIRNPKVYKDGNIPGFDSVADAYKFQQKLKAQGYDGIVHDMTEVGGEIHFVAFEPSQAITEAKAAPKAKVKPAEPLPVPKVEEITEPTPGVKLSPEQEAGIQFDALTRRDAAFESFQRKIVDAYQPVRKTQKAIEKAGGVIAETENIDQALTLFPGETRDAVDNYINEKLKPLRDLIVESGVSFEEASKFLVARHTKEANADLIRKNPERADNEALSGMTNKEAADILDEYKGNEKLQEAGRLNDQMNNERIDSLVDNGLLSKQEAASWKKFEHYVPLQRSEVDKTGIPGTGQGFDVRGRPTKLRAGSDLEVDYENLLAHIWGQHIGFITRAQKNTVSKTLFNLAEKFPDPNLWIPDHIPPVNTTNAKGEIIQVPNLLDKNLLVFKEGGENKYLYFVKGNPEADKMAAAMKNLNKSNDNAWVNALGKFNRYLSQIVTSWSPEFMLSNFSRDIQTAVYNLTDTDLKNFTAQVMKGVPSAMAGIHSELRGDGTHPMAETFKSFRKTGAMTGWLQSYDNVQDQMSEIRKEVYGWDDPIRKHISKKQVDKVFKFVGDYNTVVENAVRLSAYETAIRSKEDGGAGLTKRQAAQISKELTVDFNRKGEWGTAANSMYLFFNASVQGSARLLRAATSKENTRLKKMMIGTVALSASLEVFNRLVSQGDEDEESGYDVVRDREGSRSIILMLGEEDFIKIPMPWGYNVLHIMGQELGGVMSHAMGDYPQYSAANGAVRLAFGAMDAFNPVMEGSFMQTISPTIFDPFVRIAENKDWHGGPLYPNFNPEAPNYTKFYGSARKESKWLARIAYEAGLNPETMQPMSLLDFSPEWVDMTWDFLTGGLGRFVADSKKLGEKLISGEEIEAKEVPFARKFIGQVGKSARKQSYYNKSYDLINMDIELRRIKDKDGVAAYKEFKKGVGKERLRLVPAAKRARKDVNRLKKLKAKAQRRGNNARAKELETKIQERMKRFSALYSRKLYGKSDF